MEITQQVRTGLHTGQCITSHSPNALPRQRGTRGAVARLRATYTMLLLGRTTAALPARACSQRGMQHMYWL